MSTVARVLDRLPAVVSIGLDSWRATCPACGERLTITRAGADVFVICSDGCSARRVLAAIGLQLDDLPPSAPGGAA